MSLWPRGRLAVVSNKRDVFSEYGNVQWQSQYLRGSRQKTGFRFVGMA